VAGATGIYSGRNGKPDAELVDITGLGLGAIEAEDGRFSIGATATLTQIVGSAALSGSEGELLRKVAAGITAHTMRNMITLGGNIAFAAFWADMPVALLALDAEIGIQHAGRPVTAVPIADCLKGHAPWAGGLITRVLVPAKGRSWGYERFSRTSNDYPMATACVTLRRDGEVARDVRLAIGALQPRAFRATEIESMLEGQAFTVELVEKAARKLSESVPVAPSFRASPEYRRELAGTMARRALRTAFGRQES
jgi:carbon-monoxide dehydrogenase medium subunit